MTGAKVEWPQYGRMFRGLAFAVGLLLLADSISQLVQAAGSIQADSLNWRVANLRLLFTQVTPLTLGLLLAGQYFVRSASGWRAMGWLTVTMGALVVALAIVFLLDARAVISTMSGPPLGALKRGSVQVLLSAGGFALALLLTGGLSLRVRTPA